MPLQNHANTNGIKKIQMENLFNLQTQDQQACLVKSHFL